MNNNKDERTKAEKANDAGTIGDVLEHLDGMGLILTDDELLDKGLAEMGLTKESEVE